MFQLYLQFYFKYISHNISCMEYKCYIRLHPHGFKEGTAEPHVEKVLCVQRCLICTDIITI